MKNTLILLSFVAFTADAQTSRELSLSDLVSGLSRHPEYVVATSEFKANTAAVGEAKGAFDTHLVGEVSEAVEGYYDTSVLDVGVSQRVPKTPLELELGIRRGSGLFASYDKRETLRDGEFRIGASLPLLNGFVTDKERVEIAKSKLVQQQSDAERTLVLLSLTQRASMAYWTHVYYLSKLQTYKQMLDIAKQREEAMQKQFDSGNTSAIAIVDVQREVAARTASVVQSKLDVANSRLKLNYFLPQKTWTTPVSQLARKEFVVGSANADRDVPNIESRPELQVATASVDKAKLSRNLAENELLPKVDGFVRASKDFGDGPVSLQAREIVVGINMAFPIQNRRARYSARKAESLEERALAKKEAIARKLEIAVTMAKQSTLNMKERVRVQQRLMQLAEKMAEAARQQFSAGAVDLFVLNTREKDSAKARIALLSAALQLKLAELEMDYYGY